MKIGAVCQLNSKTYPDLFSRVASFGFKTCQLVCWDTEFTKDDLDAKAAEIRRQMEATGVFPSAFWAGWSGMMRWNFTEGPATLGIVPVTHRWHRVEELKRGALLASKIGLKAIITHCGFLPEDMHDPLYHGTVLAIVEVAAYCKSLGLGFWFETGQETPVTLLRTIQLVEQDQGVGEGVLGINLDPANLLLYGKGNPCDALKVFGKYVRNIHVKDGMVPTDGVHLGLEKQVGEGMVDFPRFVKKLLALGFDGEFIIEREIPEGDEQRRDIRQTAENLVAWAK